MISTQSGMEIDESEEHFKNALLSIFAIFVPGSNDSMERKEKPLKE
jgi:hypothetical protein